MGHPGDIDLGPIERLEERVGRRAGHFAPRIGAEERVAVSPHQSAGNAPGGKMRAAFFQRIIASSSLPRNDSRYRSLAHPVSIVMSLPHSKRLAPTLSRQASSIPPSTPLPDRST